MPDAEHLIVDLQVAHEAISGSVKVPGGDRAAFEGWLGLISIIERVQANLDRQEARGMDTSESPPMTGSDRRTNLEGDHHDEPHT